MRNLKSRSKNTVIKNRGIVSVILLSFLLSACGGESNSNTSSPPSGKEIGYVKLLPPDDGQVYFGAFTSFTGSEDKVTKEKIEDFDTLAGKKIAWSYFSNNWTSMEDAYEHTPEIKFPTDSIYTIHDLGKTPFVRLLPWASPHMIYDYSEEARMGASSNLVPICHKKSKLTYPPHDITKLVLKDTELQSHLDQGDTLGPCFNDFSMQSIIDGAWDKDLRQWAQDSLNTTDTDGNPIPLLVTFTVEMNGSWFPWSGIYNGGSTTNEYGDKTLADGPERFRDAYRHIIELFRAEGANHITWFFSPDAIDPNESWISFLKEDWNHIKNYYPGDDYIDWIGISMYGASNYYGQWDTLEEELALKSQAVTDLGSVNPIALLETAVIEEHVTGNKSEWIEGALNTILNEQYLKISAISWWNDEWEGANMRIDSSEESLLTFRQLISNPRFTSELNFSQ